jgi:hypothetical protein
MKKLLFLTIVFLIGSNIAICQIPVFSDNDLIKLPHTIQQGANYVIIDDMIFLIDRTRKTTGAFRPINAWTDGKVYYTFDESVTHNMKSILESAFSEWEKYTSIRFFQRETEDNYILIIETDRNSSYVGMTGGQQILNMLSHHTGVAIHELGHALGLIHEHQRSDRNNYVKIFLENVEQGKQHNFRFIAVSLNYTPYDFLSIMHYRKSAFGIGRLNTIEPLPAYMEFIDKMGQRDSLTTKDIQTINNLYNQIPAILNPKKGTNKISQIGADLKWSNVPNASSFQIQVAMDSLFHSIKEDISVDPPFPHTQQIYAHNYILTDLIPSTTYFWRVRAFTSDGPKRWSSISNFTIESNSPEDFWLYPAYPNPFNNTTTIKFELKKPEFVTINIYDVLGKKVSELASGEFMNGTYTLNWDAKQFASALYYCHFQAGSTSHTIKLLLNR